MRYNENMSSLPTSQPTTSAPTAPATEPSEQRIALLDLSFAELTDYLATLGEPAFRARQIWEWIYKRYVLDFEQMTNLPKQLRTRLARVATIDPLTPVVEVTSLARNTRKVLFQLHDGQTIEAVLMVYAKRRTLCISSQAGCAMGCTFCATAQGGLARNLTPGEIVAQVLFFARYLADTSQVSTSRVDRALVDRATIDAAESETSEDRPLQVDRPTHVTNIVLMGMGEPLHNYANVWTALHRLTEPESFGLGARHITLSTVGLVPMIDRMADEPLQINLAVSLHAPNDELRTGLVPVNRGYRIDDLLAAVARYIAKTNRRVTFEYALMNGINDSAEMAEELAQKLAPLLCHVNVIPLNPIPDSPYQPTSDADTERFVEILRAHEVPATVRLRRGIEINAGCGQLRQSASGQAEQGTIELQA